MQVYAPPFAECPPGVCRYRRRGLPLGTAVGGYVVGLRCGYMGIPKSRVARDAAGTLGALVVQQVVQQAVQQLFCAACTRGKWGIGQGFGSVGDSRSHPPYLDARLRVALHGTKRRK